MDTATAGHQPSHGHTNTGGGDHSELHPAATYLGSPCCAEWAQVASLRVWLCGAVCVSWMQNFPGNKPELSFGILSFLSRMFKFKPQICGWQGTGANKEPNNVLSAPGSPACPVIPPVQGNGGVQRLKGLSQIEAAQTYKTEFKNPSRQ